MQIEHVSPSAVRPDPDNARRHERANIDAIKASLERFGQQYPIVVRADGLILKGGGTYAAVVELGWATIAVVRSGLEGDESRAYALVDNHSSDLSSFDPDVLALTLDDLGAAGIDVASLGFDVAEPEKEEEATVDAERDLIEHDTKAPPAMAWVLIGIPTIRFGELADMLERATRIPGIHCETTVSGAA